MRTKHFQKILTSIILACLLASTNLSLQAQVSAVSEKEAMQQDTVKYTSFSGKIMDKRSGDPVVYANVYLEGSNIGVVTNADGEFLLKIPASQTTARLGIAHLGYRKLMLNVSDLRNEENKIFLVPVTIPIEEVTVRFTNPEEMIYQALRRRTDNYSVKPVMMTSFYRETIKQNRNYVAVSEAVLDIYKSPYVKSLESDRTKIFKGRKSQDVKKMDTILFKLQGGPYTALLLDVVKNPGDVLSEEFINLYDYKFTGINYIDDRETYVISFKQKPYVTDPLYQGNIYIDAENLAFSGIDFNLNIDDPELVSQMFIRKKPAGMRVEVNQADYLTKYRLAGNTWYLSYVRLETEFKCKWDRKLFNSDYTTMTEMAVTNIDKENINKFRYRESAKMSDILAEQVSQFEDPDFWGDYNIIKPDESIQDAIDKLSRKLKRRM